MRNPLPHPTYRLLVYHQGSWLLHHKNGAQIRYDTARVLIHAGLFFLLECRSEMGRKVMVVFVDQLTREEYRFLRIREKIK